VEAPPLTAPQVLDVQKQVDGQMQISTNITPELRQAVSRLTVVIDIAGAAATIVVGRWATAGAVAALAAVWTARSFRGLVEEEASPCHEPCIGWLAAAE